MHRLAGIAAWREHADLGRVAEQGEILLADLPRFESRTPLLREIARELGDVALVVGTVYGPGLELLRREARKGEK